MVKILGLVINLFIFFFLLPAAHGQTEKFDITTYTPPKNWKKDSKPGIILLTNINESKGVYCLIAIYASEASAGEPEEDFANEWNNRAVNAYGAAAGPKTETQTSADGWKVVAGAASINMDSINSYLVLTVFSGFGKKMSVLANFNDESYLKSIDELLENLKLDKNAVVAKAKAETQPAIPAAVSNPSTKPATIAGVNSQNNLQSQKFGSVIYTAPANWKEQLYTDGVIWTATGLQPGELLLMQLMQPINLRGTLEELLQKSYDEICASLKATKMHDVNGGNYTMLQPKRSFKGWDYIRCSGGIQMGDGQSLREYGLDVFLIKINNRSERVYVLKSRNNCNLSRYYPSDKLNYHNDIENFLFSLKFQDWQDVPVTAGTIKGAGIVGVWEGIALRVGMPKAGAPLGAEFKSANAIFFSNGQAYYGTRFPIEGLDEANIWIYAENNRRDWGTYTFSNGKGILKMPYQDIPLRMENNNLIITPNKTDHTFVKLNGVDGAKFAGTYVFSSKDFLGAETGKTPTILFSTDGKFSDKGAMSILYHEYVDCLNLAKQPGTGTYEVRNHSLIFNYADGRKIKIAFVGSGYDKTNLSPHSLSFSFNEDVLIRQ